ncbi:hypothetical protein A2U01_0020232 [Trifolium medium]|uniref:Uncharacterized protein n=1 Tax=Trifolium medium TaxID=97028 RepID=A0A392NIE5_9FABA|nr:hypothetical protein [Trifolium medium]
MRQYCRITDETLSSTQPQKEQHHEPVEDTDCDARSDDYISDEEKKAEKPLSQETIMRFERPKPDGEFITVQLDNNPTKVVKIGANLPPLIQESLVRCLKANADVFATSPEKMLGIDPEVACHRLNVNPNMKFIAQRRRRQSPEKAEAARTIVEGLVQA